MLPSVLSLSSCISAVPHIKRLFSTRIKGVLQAQLLFSLALQESLTCVLLSCLEMADITSAIHLP